MKIKIYFISAALLWSLSATAAETNLVALTSKLTSPALWPIAPEIFTCSLTNVTTKNHAVRLRIIQDGNTLKDSGKISLAAQHTKGLDMQGLPEGGYFYCEFTVDGLKSWYRGVAKLYHAGGADFLAIPAE
ncbi:MAG: hypothetical protein ACU837_01755 [Gammaproteobacteria bacterium]